MSGAVGLLYNIKRDEHSLRVLPSRALVGTFGPKRDEVISLNIEVIK